MTAKTGNKGEWSEIYVLLKLLGEGTLYAADADLNKLEDIFYPIITIFREESGKKTQYHINGQIKITDQNDNLLFSIPATEFKQKAEMLLKEIKEEHDGPTFSVSALEEFLTVLNCHNIAQGGGAKKDLEIKVHDMRTGTEPVLGFSIKSLLGQNATLFNPGKNTNFKYSVSFPEQTDIDSINSGKPAEIFQYIKEYGKIKFEGVCDDNFNANMLLIDSSLPKILAELLLSKYIHRKSTIKESLEDLEKTNPLKFPNSDHPFYAYKIKAFLTDVALGMTPAKVWKGNYDATGGIIVVKKDGEVLCYHIYNRNEFQDYLLNNTKLEQASTGRYDFGKIYEENGKLFINLNLQIRFC